MLADCVQRRCWREGAPARARIKAVPWSVSGKRNSEGAEVPSEVAVAPRRRPCALHGARGREGQAGLTVRLGPGPRGRRRWLLVLQRGGGGRGRGGGRRDEEPLEAVGRAAGHLQASRQLGLVGAGQPLEVHEQLRLVAAEVRAVEVVERPVARRPAAPRPRPGPRRARPAQHHLAEAVEVELADEAGEVGGFEELGLGPGAPDAAAPARAAGPRPGRAEQLGLEERLVDEQPLAAAVPADRAVPGAVHQPPQLGGEVVGVDGGGEQRLLHRPARALGLAPPSLALPPRSRSPPAFASPCPLLPAPGSRGPRGPLAHEPCGARRRGQWGLEFQPRGAAPREPTRPPGAAPPATCSDRQARLVRACTQGPRLGTAVGRVLFRPAKTSARFSPRPARLWGFRIQKVCGGQHRSSRFRAQRAQMVIVV